MGRDSSDAVGEELARIRDSARYLLAVCCYELGMYGEAEEALMRRVRQLFGKAVSSGGKVRGNVNEVMDAWILQSDVSVLCYVSCLLLYALYVSGHAFSWSVS